VIPCSLGQVRGSVYKFVKALIRRFGEDWYLELDKVKNNFKVSILYLLDV
jgi:hypothetical protein